LGQILTEKSLAKLEQKAEQFRFNVDGEGGEYETLVIGGPHLPGRLEIEGQSVWKGNRGTFECSKVVPVIR
jgi:diphthamide synthase (EF-2-diphthine--ammonia ligase)